MNIEAILCIVLICFLQYLRIEFDDQGNLNNITNLDSNITLPFSAQGLYWYTSKYLPLLHMFIQLFYL